MEFSFKSLYEHLVTRWHLMVAFGLVGALLAALLTGIGPDRYAARATVMVDQQVDLALPPLSPVNDVLYVSRETVRLEDLSYADDLWEEVFVRMSSGPFETEFSDIDALRHYASAPHYQDGAWYLTAEHPDPGVATTLANAWAETFVDTAQSWVQTAQLEISLRSQLEAIAGMRAVAVDACGQLDWAGARVSALLHSTLSQLEVAESDFKEAASLLAQVAASLPAQSIREIEALTSDDLEGARQMAEEILTALDLESAACHARLDFLQQQEQTLLEQMKETVEDSFGVSPYLRVRVSQLAGEAERVQADLGAAALAGLVVAIALWLMADVSGFLDRLLERL